jgi:hypothetical protein
LSDLPFSSPPRIQVEFFFELTSTANSSPALSIPFWASSGKHARQVTTIALSQPCIFMLLQERHPAATKAAVICSCHGWKPFLQRNGRFFTVKIPLNPPLI